MAPRATSRCWCLALLGLAAASTGAEAPLGLPPVPVSQKNPQSAAKIALGKKLFEDPRLSSTGLISCSSCHDEKKAFADGPLETSRGIHGFIGTRNAPSLVNVAWSASLFWDGRSASLEEQARQPLTNPIEMGLLTCEPVLELIRTDAVYRVRFEDAFGKIANQATLPELLQAIAVFERTLVGGDSAFDRFWFAGDEEALSPAQQRGLTLFLDKGRCVSCHVIEQTSALFTDNRFHNLGVGRAELEGRVRSFLKTEVPAAQLSERVLVDPGTSDLGRLAVSRVVGDVGAFKTPTLRNVARTAPYMHDGSLKTLEEVVTWHANGGVPVAGQPASPFVSSGLRPVSLTEAERSDLVAFLEALTSPQFLRPGGT